jgi:hypothetical protein
VVTLARPDVKEAVIDLPIGLAEQLSKGLTFTVPRNSTRASTPPPPARTEPQADATTRTRRARLTLASTPAAFHLGTAISVTLSSAITPRIDCPSALLERDGKTRSG